MTDTYLIPGDSLELSVVGQGHDKPTITDAGGNRIFLPKGLPFRWEQAPIRCIHPDGRRKSGRCGRYHKETK